MIACVVAWALSLIAGLGGLVAYKGREGATSSPPQLLPVSFASTNNARPTLLLFVHPKCSCTTATVSELARTIASTNDDGELLRPDIVVVAATWGDRPDAWCRTSMVESLLNLPRSRLVIDRDAAITHAMDIKTSGHVLFYDEQGALLFSGGITPARGHEGPNTGESELVELIRGDRTRHKDTPTYGCALVQEACELRCH